MSFNYNHITLVGRLNSAPEVRKIGDITKVTFNLMVERPYRKDDWVMESDFIPVVVWGKLADLAEKYLHKGRPTLIEGRLQIADYESSDKNQRIEVVAENFQVLERLSS